MTGLANARRGTASLSSRSLIVALGLTLIGVPVAPSAEAYTFLSPPCRYDPSNDDDGLGVGYANPPTSSAVNEKNATISASARWNSVFGPDFTTVSFSSPQRDLKVEWSGTLPASTFAMFSWSCGGSGWYSSDPTFTWNTIQGYNPTTEHMIAIALHEFGHSYGMGHNPVSGCAAADAGLMASNPVAKQDECGWIYPTQDDIEGATDAHNG